MLILGVSDLRLADFTRLPGRRVEAEVPPHAKSTAYTTAPTASGSTAPAPPRRWSGRGSVTPSTSTAPCTAPTSRPARRCYRQEAGFDELHSYNHIGVAASPTLIGKNIAVMDNQGSCLVFEPGPVSRRWP